VRGVESRRRRYVTATVPAESMTAEPINSATRKDQTAHGVFVLHSAAMEQGNADTSSSRTMTGPSCQPALTI
jgi:hypothetical protein